MPNAMFSQPDGGVAQGIGDLSHHGAAATCPFEGKTGRSLAPGEVRTPASGGSRPWEQEEMRSPRADIVERLRAKAWQSEEDRELARAAASEIVRLRYSMRHAERLAESAKADLHDMKSAYLINRGT